MSAAFKSFPDFYRKLVLCESISCMSTGDDIPPTICPTAVITDVRFLFRNLLDAIHILTHKLTPSTAIFLFYKPFGKYLEKMFPSGTGRPQVHTSHCVFSALKNMAVWETLQTRHDTWQRLPDRMSRKSQRRLAPTSNINIGTGD